MGYQAEAASFRRRTPGLLNLAGALVVLLLVVSVALRASQNNPPAVAEFAPQPQHPIQQAPNEQTASFGRGSGGAGGGPAPSPAPAPSPPNLNGVVIRQCVGDPPRQIEDPQSPPCIPYWHGNNGGATYKGVGPLQITIEEPEYVGDLSPLLQTFFNTRFEFYGRQISLQHPSLSSGSASADRAAADYVDSSVHAFASMENTDANAFFYYDELARRHVIGVADRDTFTEQNLKTYSPYIWAYPMASDREFSTLGSWICARLAGRPATHTGDPTLQGKPRKFGLLLTTEASGRTDEPVSAQPLEQAMAACGSSLDYQVQTYGAPDSATLSSAILRMKQDSVTTVICLCHTFDINNLSRNADQQAYFPEWVLSTYLLNDYSFLLGTLGGDRNQLAHAMGLTFQPMERPYTDEPFYWAAREVQPSFTFNGSAFSTLNDEIEYRNLLLIASGIQMAGPNLTPATFAAGLWRTIFPNPAYYTIPGKVGFNGGFHTMTIDAAEFWWSNSDKGPYSDQSSGGTLCYVDGGARHDATDWPQGGDPFFREPCTS